MTEIVFWYLKIKPYKHSKNEQNQNENNIIILECILLKEYLGEWKSPMILCVPNFWPLSLSFSQFNILVGPNQQLRSPTAVQLNLYVNILAFGFGPTCLMYINRTTESL